MTDTINLAHPFDFEGEKITELHLRRPKVRDIKKSELEVDEFKRSVNMIADLAEVTPKLVEELDVDDFQTISERVGEYMGVSAD